jgi:FkbM family methyltransferase
MRKRVKSIARALEPRGSASLRSSLRFGNEHRLSSGRRAWIEGFPAAIEFGLQHLPAGATLAGLVIDAGANRGDFTAVIRRLEPESRVLAIEPIPQERSGIERRFADDPRVVVDGHALSASPGAATLNITSHSVHASLLPAVEDTMAIYGDGADVVAQVEVETAPLDDLVDEPVKLLKIDVQGHEIPALRGAEKTLVRTDVVLLEVLFQSHYEGDSSFFELDTFMREAGFVLCGMSIPNEFGGRVLWGDACYRRIDA